MTITEDNEFRDDTDLDSILGKLVASADYHIKLGGMKGADEEYDGYMDRVRTEAKTKLQQWALRERRSELQRMTGHSLDINQRAIKGRIDEINKQLGEVNDEDN